MTKDSGLVFFSDVDLGESPFYIQKLDSKGNTVWKKVFGSKKCVLSNSTKTIDGGFALLAYTKDFGAFYIDALIIKTDSNGESGPSPNRSVKKK